MLAMPSNALVSSTKLPWIASSRAISSGTLHFLVSGCGVFGLGEPFRRFFIIFRVVAQPALIWSSSGWFGRQQPAWPPATYQALAFQLVANTPRIYLRLLSVCAYSLAIVFRCFQDPALPRPPRLSIISSIKLLGHQRIGSGGPWVNTWKIRLPVSKARLDSATSSEPKCENSSAWR